MGSLIGLLYLYVAVGMCLCTFNMGIVCGNGRTLLLMDLVFKEGYYGVGSIS